jgi:hypothetical protein
MDNSCPALSPESDEVRHGVVVSITTAGNLVQWQAHLLTTDGGKTADGW